MKGKGVGLWEFNTTFNNSSVMSLVVSLITEENRSTQRKQLTFRDSPTNFSTKWFIEYMVPEWDSNLQLSGNRYWLHRLL